MHVNQSLLGQAVFKIANFYLDASSQMTPCDVNSK